MTAYVEWFCNYCNASCQVRKAGDEISTGYYRSPLDMTPPLGWFETRSGEHACGECPQSRTARGPANADSYNEHYGLSGDLAVQPHREDGFVVGSPDRAAAAAVPPASRTTWPSRSSPFTGCDTEDTSSSGGVRDDG